MNELDELDKEISDELADVQNRAFIVFHPSWGYFTSDYNLEQIAFEVGGKEPSAQDMARVIEEAEKRNIKVVFASLSSILRAPKSLPERLTDALY